MRFIFEHRYLEWVEDETSLRVLCSIELDEFVHEIFTEFFFRDVQWCAHADLQGSRTYDSGLLEASVLSYWLDHRGGRPETPLLAHRLTHAPFGGADVT